jgi:peptide/nickel transport system substrate-binding protein
MAKTRDDLTATVHAMDRLLMNGYYFVPFYYQGADHFAYWGRLRHPAQTPLYGQAIETWWKE